jgi:hypothetical protein
VMENSVHDGGDDHAITEDIAHFDCW